MEVVADKVFVLNRCEGYDGTVVVFTYGWDSIHNEEELGTAIERYL